MFACMYAARLIYRVCLQTLKRQGHVLSEHICFLATGINFNDAINYGRIDELFFHIYVEVCYLNNDSECMIINMLHAL